jgi:hypothetical protein
MSSSSDDKPKSAGEKILEKFRQGVNMTDEEIQRESQTPDPLEGMSRESAYIDDDGSLVMHYWSQKDYVVGDGWDHLMPGDKDYDELCKKHGLKKPGDSNVIVMRFINGEWIEEKHGKADKAKSA